MGLVFLKELKELLRDKRTLFFMIALPVLVFPVIFAITAFVSSKAVEEAKSEVLDFVVVGGQYGGDLLTQLQETEGFKQVTRPAGQTLEGLINQEVIDFAVEIPENFSGELANNGQSVVKLHLNDASVNFVFDRVQTLIDEISAQRQTDIFSHYDISPSLQTAMIEPVVLEKVDIANERESLGEQVGGFIPYLLFIICLQASMVTAIDLGAGEKERGTLETLLISPIDRTQIVLGKFLTISTVGIVTSLITVLSLFIWTTVASQGMSIEIVSKVAGQIGIVDMLLMFLMIIPVSGIFASGLLCLSIYAKSMKEANGYAGSTVMLVVIPLVFALLPGVTLDSGWAWVPLTNIALAMKELFKGTMDYYALLNIFLSTCAVAAVFIGFCVYWFKKEKVLFR